MSSYDPKTIEPKWQKFWEETGLFRMDPDSPKTKYYCLMMFPYPSGTLHVGHGRNYILGDAIARYKIMRGFNLLAPMGWDAFGLPAENAAIEAAAKGGTEIHPRDFTMQNIAFMKEQFVRWGTGYDWSREITACEPDYYKWTQWFFLKLYEHDLAFKKLGPVNWCPSCQTVLANEQVTDKGKCERCEAEVSQKELEQWYFRITKYADRLLEDLDLLDGWPENVKIMQENWIGRSEGVEIYFRNPETGESLPCFTTRPDTIFGVSFVALAPEHPWVAQIAERSNKKERILDFVSRATSVTHDARTSPESEKEGLFLDRHVTNPLTGERTPLWVVNFAVMEYGTGAVMGVPAHDQRDFLFAKKYSLPVRVVVNPPGASLDPATMTEAFEGNGTQVNSGEFTSLPNSFAAKKIVDALEEKHIGKTAVAYRLRDWLISRQRYWGAPIPILYCLKCGVVPVPEKELPVELPIEVTFRPTGQSPLSTVTAFSNAPCPKCKGPARRETDTMDTFVDSAWYFLRYLTPRETKRAFDKELVNRWLPVDLYVGGVEHAILHLLYARFVIKVLYDLQLADIEEPFEKLFTQGMITKDGAKMSKSKGNVVNPDELGEKFGADTQRLYILFMGPPDRDAEWSDQGVLGAHRFLVRLWDFVVEHAERLQGIPPKPARPDALPEELVVVRHRIHRTIQKVTDKMEGDFHFNTAISSIMELTNAIGTAESYEKHGKDGWAVLREALESTLLLLAPLVPHFAEELWERLGHPACAAEPRDAAGRSGGIFRVSWPTADPEIAKSRRVEIVVQVNGKVRDRLTVDADLPEEELKAAALALEKIQQNLSGKAIENVIVVPNRLVNIVCTSGSAQEVESEPVA